MTSSNFCHNCFAESLEAKCARCGYVSKDEQEDELALAPGTILNNIYKVGRVLGTGGFGITYKAQDIKSGAIVAVKEYVPMNMVYRDFNSNNLEVKMDKQKKLYDEGLMSFIEEANYLVLLKSSTRIVNIFNCFNENNTAYFAMEYLEGNPLDNVKGMNYSLALKCMLQAAEGLKVVHNRGIVHRDISPQNIFMLNDGSIKLIDFGNARFMDKSSMNDERLILKPGFAPPELYMKENVQGPWTDIYSLAATFYRLVTNMKLPNALERINGTAIVPIRRFLPNISYGVEVAINRALELDYDKRQRSVYEFLEEINNPAYNSTDYTEYYEANNEVNKVNNVGNVNNAGVGKFKNPFSGLIRELSAKKNAEPKRQIQPQPVLQPSPRQGASPQVQPSTPSVQVSRPQPQPQIQPQIQPQKSRVAYVLAYDGRKYVVSDIRSLVVGREVSTSHIVINDAAISRKHCVVECNISRLEFYITDWSSNGTFTANGTRIGYGTKYTLMAGSEFYVYLPKYKFKVVIE
jgi:serine/threonine protein kinase